MTQTETEYLARAILSSVNAYTEYESIAELAFKTGRSAGAIRHVIDVEMPKRGHVFEYRADPSMCDPDPDEKDQTTDQHIRIYVYLA